MSLELLATDVETDLRQAVRALLDDRCDPARVTAMYDGDRTIIEPLWHGLSTELGVAGLLVPEAHGGAGASTREAATVVGELGRYAAPTPFLTSSVIATTALIGSDTPLLERLASGEMTAALVVPWSSSPYDPPALDASSDTVTSVAGALEADLLLVPVRSGDSVALHAVPAADARITPVVSLDMTRQLADVQITHLPPPVRDDAGPAISVALITGAALLAAEQVGVASSTLQMTVDYLTTRRQFGRPLGSFQALKHRLADLYVAVESGDAAATYAAAALAADDDDQVVATAVAQAFCADLAVRATEESVQLHGGIGMTWEHPAHLFLKRAKADQIALGPPATHRAYLGSTMQL